MAITPVVSPSILTPGLYLQVNLLAGTASPGTGALRVALIATPSSAGDITTSPIEVRAGGGIDSAETAFGTGTAGHLAAKQIYGQYGAALVDFVGCPSGAGTATTDVTFAGVPTSNNTVDCNIMGRAFEVVWSSGVAADTFKTTMINAINALSTDLAVVASSGGSGIVTIDSKVDGNIGNDIKVKMTLRDGTVGTETINATTTIDVSLAGGSADPDLGASSGVLETIAGREYHYIYAALSNTDVANVASASNVQDIVAHIETYNTGLEANLQQFIVGYTGSIATAIAMSVHANGGDNSTFGEVINCVNGRSLPSEIGAREVGGRLAAVSLDPAANRIGELLDGIYGSLDKIADKPTAAESETALGGGVSLVSYTAQDSEFLLRAVTTHSQDSVGGADRRLLDTQNVDGAYIVSRDVRDNLPLAFPNAKIQEDAEAGDDPPPAGVTEERDIKGWIISRLRFWVRRGVVNGAELDSAIDNGDLIVAVNSSDATQVDIVMPFEIIQPLAKFGVDSRRVPS